MQETLSIPSLIADAGLVVQGIMLLLMFMSCASLAIWIAKVRQLKAIRQRDEKFYEFFASGDSLQAVFDARDRYGDVPLFRLFKRCYSEFQRLPVGGDGQISHQHWIEATTNNLERQANAAVMEEIGHLQEKVTFLAIVSSTGPFIGLFGTVWGIMNAFIQIGAQGSSSLGVVAPGIAEALIATALGLFAAIPAAVGYNFIQAKLKGFSRRYQGFTAEMISLLVRAYLRRHNPGVSSNETRV